MFAFDSNGKFTVQTWHVVNLSESYSLSKAKRKLVPSRPSTRYRKGRSTISMVGLELFIPKKELLNSNVNNLAKGKAGAAPCGVHTIR